MLVTTDELAPRLPFVMDADELREATGALEDLSFDAQSIGSATWIDALSTPETVKNLILRAAARHMKNYEGYTQSRAGDETVAWAEQETPGTATFTKDEKAMLQTLAGKTKFIGGVSNYAWGTQPVKKVGYVPVGYAPTNPNADFPLFSDPVEPW